MNTHKSGGAQAGFTLIELMITLLIASVLIGMVAPSMATLVDNNRLQTSAEVLFTSMMLTRSEALKRNREVIMCKSSDGSSCTEDTEWQDGWLVFVDTDEDGVVDADEILRVNGALGGDTSLQVSGTDFSDQMSYQTDGSASGTGTFVLCNARADTATAREVDVSLTGRPKINKSTASCTPA